MSLKVAILDDYHNLSRGYIADLPSSVSTTVFTDTILPSQDLPALLERLKGYNVLVTMRERTPITREVIDGLAPHGLSVILTTAMRNRGIEVECAKEKGIVVAGTPAPAAISGTPPNLSATVQHTWALILALVTHIPRDNAVMNSGSWLGKTPLNAFLPGKTLGLLGLGKLGTGVARIGKLAFGMNIIAWSPHLDQETADSRAREVGLEAGDIRYVEKEELLRSSDVLSLHLVLAPNTRGIVGAHELSLLKPSAYLINTSRGPLIAEKPLLDVLENGKITGYAADVFDIEPLPLDSAWRTVKWGEQGRSEVVLTPHSGYSYEDQLTWMWEKTRENLERLSKGQEVEWKM